jgi:hypothetical protein
MMLHVLLNIQVWWRLDALLQLFLVHLLGLLWLNAFSLNCPLESEAGDLVPAYDSGF